MIVTALAGLPPMGLPSVEGTVASTDGGLGQAVLMRRRHSRPPVPPSSFAGFRFPPEVIPVAVRWYLRYGLSYRDVEELLAGIVIPERDWTCQARPNPDC